MEVTETTPEAPVKTDSVKAAFEQFNAKEQAYNVNKSQAPKSESKPEKVPAPVTPAKEAVKKPEAKADDSKPESHPEKEHESVEAVEKRLKDKDRHITKLSEELKALKAGLEKRDRLLNRFSDALDLDENGDPKDWNFEKANPKAKKEDADPRPEDPNEDDDFKTFNKKLVEIAKWEIRQEQNAKEEAKRKEAELSKQKEEDSKKESARVEAINESFDMAVALFPDAAVEDSELRQKAEEIYRNNPKIQHRTDYNLYCFMKAAEELGIKPVTPKEPETQPKKDVKVVMKPSLMELGSSSGGSTSNALQGKLSAFNSREQQFIKKR